MVQINAWEEGARVKELLIELIGAPLGTIVSQLIFAAQYTFICRSSRSLAVE